MFKHFLWVFLALWFGGCGIDDEDRCLDGYYYDPAVKQCRPEVSEECGEGLNVPEGFGTTCTSPEECSAFSGASICFTEINPTGYCTYNNCSPKACPNCYQCCDCSTESETLPTICLTDGDATLATQFAGCTCS